MKPLLAVQAIVLVITVTQFCGIMGMTIDLNGTSLDVLCEGDQNQLKDNNMTVLLSAPVYTLSHGSSCLIENLINLTIRGKHSDSRSVIQCSPSNKSVSTSGFTFINIHRLTIANVVFENCGALLEEGTLHLENSSLFHFDEGEAAVLVCRNCSDLTLMNVNIIDYIGRAFIGLDIYGHSIIDSVIIADNVDELPGNQCKGSGLVWMYTNQTLPSTNTVVDIIDSVFTNNAGCRVIPDKKPFVCGDLLADSFYARSLMFQAVGIPSAGAISFINQQHSLVQTNFVNSHFTSNKGLCYGAILAIYTSESVHNALSFSGCTFSNNAQIVSNFTFLSGRYYGSTITLLMKYFGDHSKGKDCFRMTDSVFTNTVEENFDTSEIVFTQFPGSTGTCVADLRNVTGGNTRLLYAVSLETGASSFIISLSDIRLVGSEQHHSRPKLDVGDGLLTFSYITSVVIDGSSSIGSLFSKVSGPVISAEVTNVILTGRVRFEGATGSSWTSGAAMYLRGESKIWLQEPLNLTFCNNTALEGGAIYSVSRFAEYCAFQFITCEDKIYNSSNIGDIAINVIFISNHARTAGNSIYAYPLFRCSNRLSPTIEVLPQVVYDTIFNFVESYNNSLLEMSSKPLWVCLCGKDPTNTSESALNCHQAEAINTFPGKTFSVSIVPIDEAYQRVYSIIYNNLQLIESDFNNIYDFHWRLGYGEDIVRVDGLSCSPIEFTIYGNKTDMSGQITLSTSESINYLTIPVTLQNCPPGFELVYESCDCVKLFKNNGITCNISNGTVTRPGTSWIGTITDLVTDSNDTTIPVGYSEHCPTRYCNETTPHVNVSNSSSLCIYDRTGVLCGQCKTGLSITVGSPLCLECSNWWLFTIPLYALLGFLIVALLLTIQLTVAQGTINGLIFYANLLNINTYTLISGYKGSRWALIFISFLNLELGFPVCLYNGLNEINKALLSIVFPTYIWLLSLVFVYSSRCSYWLSNLTSRTAIPVLATLIYISYFKLLRFSVSGFALGIVDVQYRSDVVHHLIVWYYDGSIRYLQDHRHLLLFLMVLAVVFVFLIPFGVILTGIRFFSRFRIVNKFKPLIDAYCAPYKDRYRFWFGSRLWVLLVLYILFAILRNKPLAFLFSQAIILTLFTVVQVAIMPFRSKIINCLDLFFMLNAVLLTMTVLYTYQLPSNKNIASSISVSLTLVLFCCIIGYHAWKPLKSVVMYCRNKYGNYALLEETIPRDNVVTESSVAITPAMDVSIQQNHGQLTIHPSRYRDSILEDSVADNLDTSD